ncbi:MAG: hypothetical protein H7145_02820 [Akkermansiaceae bacterium]|nr:hypothetical protein [Armatimonadota bacterium]
MPELLVQLGRRSSLAISASVVSSAVLPLTLPILLRWCYALRRRQEQSRILAAEYRLVLPEMELLEEEIRRTRLALSARSAPPADL